MCYVGPGSAEQRCALHRVRDTRELRLLHFLDNVCYTLRSNKNRGNAREGIQRVQRRLFPIRYEELLDVANIWVDTAMQVGPQEIRLMERLAQSQGKLSMRDPISLVPPGDKSA